MSKKQTAVLEFAPRSRASVDREAKLIAARDQVQGRVDYLQRQIDEKKDYKKRLHGAIASGHADWQVRAAGDVSVEINALTGAADGLREAATEFTQQIDAERAIPANRAKIVAQIAELAGKRLEQHGIVQDCINRLRQALSESNETTKRMVKLGEEIEFSGDLDAEREMELAASLPAFLKESEIRTADLLGAPSDVLVRAVARVRIDTGAGESLRHVGIYEPTHELWLTPGEFAQLSRTDLPHPKAGAYDGKEVYELASQRVCSFEQYERDREEAEAEDVSVETIWFRQDAERNGVAKEKWEVEDGERRFQRRIEGIRSATGRGLEYATEIAERERKEHRRLESGMGTVPAFGPGN